MTSRTLFPLVLVLGCFHPFPAARAKENKPTGWAYAHAAPVEVRASPSNRKPGVAHLGRGALVKVYETVSKGTISWSQVYVVDLETLSPRMGWVESNEIESLPLDQFPTDADLLKLLGGTYLDDFTVSHAEIGRFLLRQGSQEPALACFLASPVLPLARLQVFRRSQGKFVPGAFLEFPLSEMKAGITAMEVLDLFADGNECLVSHEPFDFGPENRGVNLVIRRVEDNQFQKLWEAPLEYRNLSSFPSQPRILDPAERNIGSPGTVTKGTVDFRARGSLREPVWKGKIEFHVFGRDEPLETVKVEKVCAWGGTKFMPLR